MLNFFLKEIRFSILCPHETAHKYPVLKPPNSCQYIAYKCKDYSTFELGKCAEEGLPLEFNPEFYDKTESKLNETQPPNNLFIKIGDSPPFCLFHYQIVVNIISNLKTIEN